MLSLVIIQFSKYFQVPGAPPSIARQGRKYSLPGTLVPGDGPLLRTPRTEQTVAEVPKDHYRVVVMGAPRVGKTAIISQFLYDTFIPEYKATVEEMHRGEYDIAGSPLVLEILDTSGSNEFPAMRALSVGNADAFILVYAIDDAASFDEVRKLRDMIHDTKPSTSCPTVIVGNKSDLALHQRQVSTETAETIVNIDWENGFVEASAKDNLNIINIFTELLAQANVRYELSPAVKKRRQSLPSNSPVKLANSRTTKRNSCAVS